MTVAADQKQAYDHQANKQTATVQSSAWAYDDGHWVHQHPRHLRGMNVHNPLHKRLSTGTYPEPL
jgi:hypothetical protein